MHILLYHITASLTSKIYILLSNIWRIQRFFTMISHHNHLSSLSQHFSEGQIFGMHITASCTLLYANVLLMLMRFLFVGHYIWLLRFFRKKYYCMTRNFCLISMYLIDLLVLTNFNLNSIKPLFFHRIILTRISKIH